MAFWVEPPDSRQSVADAAGVPEKGTITFDVWGTLDESEVDATVQANVPAFFRGLLLQRYEVQPEEGGIWRGKAEYARTEPRIAGGGGAPDFESKLSVSFDIAGDSVHLTQSLESKAHDSEGPNDAAAAANKNAINVTDRGVEGIDVDSARFAWTETHRVNAADVTEQYLNDLTELRQQGTNLAAFRLFAKGEVLFVGCTGSHHQGDDAEINYSFVAGKNRGSKLGGEDVLIGDISVDEVAAHDYVDVRYKDGTDDVNGIAVKVPELVIVHKIWEGGDFDKLLIGL